MWSLLERYCSHCSPSQQVSLFGLFSFGEPFTSADNVPFPTGITADKYLVAPLWDNSTSARYGVLTADSENPKSLHHLRYVSSLIMANTHLVSFQGSWMVYGRWSLQNVSYTRMNQNIYMKIRIFSSLHFVHYHFV